MARRLHPPEFIRGNALEYGGESLEISIFVPAAVMVEGKLTNATAQATTAAPTIKMGRRIEVTWNIRQ